jgi:hypothetical protein
MEWRELNREKLTEDWALAVKHQALKKIPPVE